MDILRRRTLRVFLASYLIFATIPAHRQLDALLAHSEDHNHHQDRLRENALTFSDYLRAEQDSAKSEPNGGLAEDHHHNEWRHFGSGRVLPMRSSSHRRPSAQQTGGHCREYAKCVEHHDCPFTGFLGMEKCSLGRSRDDGVCCPGEDGKSHGRDETPHRPVSPFESSLAVNREPVPDVTFKDCEEAFKLADNYTEHTTAVESEINRTRLFAKPLSKESFHQNFFGNYPQSIRRNRDGTKMIRTAYELSRKFGHLTGDQCNIAFDELCFSHMSDQDLCPKTSRCKSSKYRTADGSCNNENNPDRGKSFVPFNRIACHVYDDGFNEPRKRAKSGHDLPNARKVSFTVHPDGSRANRHMTNMLMQWGQFIDHDITQTATTRLSDGQGIQCCGDDFDRDANLRHPACFQIEVPSNDPFYAQLGQKCMSFVRSAAASHQNCNLGPREQLNQQSAYIDGSQTYGSTHTQAATLRTFQGGRLVTSIVDGIEFLPKDTEVEACGIPVTPLAAQSCFRAGDSRVNIQATMVVLQALWHRQHNRLADHLKRLNSKWKDETVYQEARRIVAAQIQHITYNEFLPLVLGKTIMKAFDLNVQEFGYAYSYDPTMDAGIISEFATAAYRMHTMIPNIIEFSTKGAKVGEVNLSDTFNNPSVVYKKGAFGEIVGGLTDQTVDTFDRYFATQVSNLMFKPLGSTFGIDLVALNIQRGRDHGLPGYNAWRATCGLEAFESFEKMNRSMSKETVEAIQSVYEHVDDIDLFVGGVSETPLKGSLLGPTFACIQGEQFKRLKDGDRFWFENGNMRHSFTFEQLDEIRKTTLARIICDNSVSVEQMQKFAFIKPAGEWNKRFDCKGGEIPKLDLTKWQS